jgi:hypothetical protein
MVYFISALILASLNSTSLVSSMMRGIASLFALGIQVPNEVDYLF